eukprot:CAMPEP_0196601828 /NCGR_PEP_ID=MMETSP1081-20130531/96111_1 /TAXON_ID=36882 /ORGANISM="Pyramimonas amylifera, Strain CCMP720" /LENGTH=642 /DNA_ID=CAMNT_0041927723 /DNA_START=610 /DNA_END=2538 /DNA_ORIENTATION=+
MGSAPEKVMDTAACLLSLMHGSDHSEDNFGYKGQHNTSKSNASKHSTKSSTPTAAGPKEHLVSLEHLSTSTKLSQDCLVQPSQSDFESNWEPDQASPSLLTSATLSLPMKTIPVLPTHSPILTPKLIVIPLQQQSLKTNKACISETWKRSSNDQETKIKSEVDEVKTGVFVPSPAASRMATGLNDNCDAKQKQDRRKEDNRKSAQRTRKRQDTYVKWLEAQLKRHGFETTGWRGHASNAVRMATQASAHKGPQQKMSAEQRIQNNRMAARASKLRMWAYIAKLEAFLTTLDMNLKEERLRDLGVDAERIGRRPNPEEVQAVVSSHMVPDISRMIPFDPQQPLTACAVLKPQNETRPREVFLNPRQTATEHGAQSYDVIDLRMEQEGNANSSGSRGYSHNSTSSGESKRGSSSGARSAKRLCRVGVDEIEDLNTQNESFQFRNLECVESKPSNPGKDLRPMLIPDKAIIVPSHPMQVRPTLHAQAWPCPMFLCTPPPPDVAQTMAVPGWQPHFLQMAQMGRMHSIPYPPSSPTSVTDSFPIDPAEHQLPHDRNAWQQNQHLAWLAWESHKVSQGSVEAFEAPPSYPCFQIPPMYWYVPQTWPNPYFQTSNYWFSPPEKSMVSSKQEPSHLFNHMPVTSESQCA